ncbi:putative sugar kinase YdjH [Streptomyces sp. RB5]|uniref:Putative sugar kinase YdjH n=1 Tax=Streptomyces smaragdinus TaxID=2585196 RepID=A0A7K0CI76_9ACTN|nr:PfkB family carbohydrate kinase [Streptomyces smaragdinus]MQY12434.1 putative sugar kinase YdjH [Streptomyces smaragdinus]
MSAAVGLLVVGDVVTDVVARHTGPLAPGTDTAARITTLPGGAGANAASWAARCGAPAVRMLGRAGRDSAGWHATELRRHGVEPRLSVDPGLPTGTVIALVDGADGAERTFLTDSGASVALTPADWDEDLLAGVAHVHLSGYLCFTPGGRELTALVAASAHARGATLSVDPASTGFIERLGVDVFRSAIRPADLILPNAAEARLLTGAADPARAAGELSAVHGTAVVTLGPGGALVARDGGPAARVPAVPADPVDTTGAGDAFTGAYLAAWLGGAEPVAAARAGCAAAAVAVGTVGGRPPPDRLRPPGQDQP